MSSDMIFVEKDGTDSPLYIHAMVEIRLVSPDHCVWSSSPDSRRPHKCDMHTRDVCMGAVANALSTEQKAIPNDDFGACLLLHSGTS